MKYNEEFVKKYLIEYLSKEPNVYQKADYCSKIPSKFYKFRTCSEYSFDSLMNEYIWLSKASEFCDTVDSSIGFDLKSDISELRDVLLDWYPVIIENESKGKKEKNYRLKGEQVKQAVLEFKNNISDNKLGFKKYALRASLRKKGLNIKDINDFMSKLGTEKIAELAIDEKQKFYKDLKDIKDSNLVFCFTDTHKNNNLWETYSDRYTGFCIEYYLPNSDNRAMDFKYNMSPMLYQKRKTIKIADIVSLAKKKYCGEHIDNRLLSEMDLKMNLSIRIKDVTYDHEREWRFFKAPASTEERKLDFPFVSKVILGKDIKILCSR